MKSRILVGVAVLFALVGVGTLARGATNIGTDKQWTLVNFMNPILVKGEYVMGPVLIVHDSAKMARGEACTTFYRFKPGVGAQEVLASFHCKPRAASVAQTNTFTVRSTDTGCKRLVEYQIAGDSEAHGVPME